MKINERLKKSLIIFISIFLVQFIRPGVLGLVEFFPVLSLLFAFSLTWGEKYWDAVFVTFIVTFIFDGVFLKNQLPIVAGVSEVIIAIIAAIVMTITYYLNALIWRKIFAKQIDFLEPKDLFAFVALAVMFSLIDTFLNIIPILSTPFPNVINFFMAMLGNLLMLSPLFIFLINGKIKQFWKLNDRKPYMFFLQFLLILSVAAIFLGPSGIINFGLNFDDKVLIILPMMVVAINFGHIANSIQMLIVWSIGYFGIYSDYIQGKADIADIFSFSVFMIVLSITILWITSISERLKKRSLYYEIQNLMLKENEERILNSEKRLDVIFRSSPTAILLIGLEDGEIIDCNEQAEKGLGFDREQLLSMKDMELGFWRDIDDRTKDIEILLRYGSVSNVEVEIARGNGIGYFNISIEPIELENKIFALTALVDITENIENQTRISKFNEELEETIERRTEDLRVALNLLEKEKETARKYLDIVGVMIVVIDRYGIVTLINDMGGKILGYNEDEIVGENWFEKFVPSIETEKVKDLFFAQIENGVDSEEFSESYIINSLGEKRLISWHSSTIKNKAGFGVGMISSGEDITEKRLSEIKLIESKEYTDSILINSPIGIYTFDDEGKCLSVNARGVEILGSSLERVIGKSFFENEEWIVSGLSNLAEETLESGNNSRIEKIFRTSHGRESWLNCSFSRFVSTGKYYLLMVVDDVTERRSTELRLKEAKEFNDKILKNSPIGIFTYDANGNCLTVNEMGSKITGKPLEDLLEYNYFSGGEWEKYGLRDLVDYTMRTGYDGVGEANLSHIRNKDMWQESRTTKFTMNGEDFLLLMISDITMRKESEVALKNAENQLRNMTNDLPLIVFQGKYHDTEFRLEFVNKKAFEMLGLEIDNGIVLRDFLVLVMKEDRRNVYEHFEEARVKLHAWKLDFRAVIEGKIRWYHCESLPVKDEKGDIVWNGYIQDTTDRVESEEEMNLFFKTSIDLLAIIDFNQYFKKVSPSWSELFGWSEDELINRPYIDFIHPDDIESTKRENTRIIDGSVTVGYLNRFRCSDGSYRWLAWNAQSKGQRGVILAVARDITESKKMEEMLIRSKNAAESADRSKSEFLANMSHEIRTPLNAVIGFSEILSSQATDQKQKVYLDSINIAGKSLLKLIIDILDLSKIEAGMMRVSLAPVSPRNIFKEIEQIFQIKVEEKGIQYITEIDETLPKVLIMDESRVRQVLLNLVGNAVKFTDKGYVKLTVVKRNIDQDGNRIDLIIAIQDTGIGVGKDDFDEVFNSFHQQNGQSDRKYGGTGLGLSISKRLAELMNGKIELESEAGIGSTFTIYLRNIAVASFERIENPDSTREVLRFEEKTVLIVDDVESNRELVKEQLTMAGLKVITAVNGEDAIYKIEKLKPDLILMDLMMPVMDGREAAFQIKSDDNMSKIPIIALTASTRIKSFSEEENSPFSGYLSKPVTTKQLYQEVGRFIEEKTGLNAVASIDASSIKEASELIIKESLADKIVLGIEELDATKIEKIKSVVGEDLKKLNKGLRRSVAMEFANKLNLIGSEIESEWIFNKASELKQAIINTDIELANSIIRTLYDKLYTED